MKSILKMLCVVAGLGLISSASAATANYFKNTYSTPGLAANAPLDFVYLYCVSSTNAADNKAGVVVKKGETVDMKSCDMVNVGFYANGQFGYAAGNSGTKMTKITGVIFNGKLGDCGLGTLQADGSCTCSARITKDNAGICMACPAPAMTVAGVSAGGMVSGMQCACPNGRTFNYSTGYCS